MEAEQKFNGKRGKKERDGDWKKKRAFIWRV